MAILQNSVVQVSVLAEADGQAVVNVLHYGADSAGGDIAVFLGQFQLLWRSLILPVVHTSYFVGLYRAVEIQSRVVVPNPPPPAPPVLNEVVLREFFEITGDPAMDDGGRAGDPLPTYAAVTYRKRTALAGRSFQGSMRIGPIVEADTNFNELVAPVPGIYNNPTAFLTSTISAGGTVIMIPQLFRRTEFLTGKLGPNDAAFFDETIISASRNRFLGSQVSRKRRPSSPA